MNTVHEPTSPSGTPAEPPASDNTAVPAASLSRRLQSGWLGWALLAAGIFLLIVAAGFFLTADGPSPGARIGGWLALVLGIASFAGWGWQSGYAAAAAAARQAVRDAVKSADNSQMLQDAGSRSTVSPEFLSLYAGLGRGDWPMDGGIGTIGSMLADDEARQRYSRLRASADQGRPDKADLALQNATGGRVWWQVMTTPQPTIPQPTISGLQQYSFADITHDRVATADRLTADRMLADLLGNMPAGFFSADAMGDLRYLNETLAGWLGLDPGNGEEKYRFSDYVDTVAEPESGAIGADSTGMHGAVTLRASDGETFPAYLIQSEGYDVPDEAPYSRSLVLRHPFIPIIEDVVGGPVLHRFPWLFGEAPVGMVLLDMQGEVTECNRAFLKLLGLHREAVVGRPLAERLAQEDQSDLSGGLSKVVMGTIRATFLDVRMPAAGEREVAGSLYISRMEDAEGEVAGMVVHVIDSTEQKNLEVQFNQSQKMQAVGQLAGGVAHDFNNLLTAMIGFCDLLLGRHGAGDPSFADIMQIKQNANRAANLVRQLLAFSRRQTLQPKTFDVTESLNDLSSLLRRLIDENIELDMSHARDLDLIRTDPGQFDQVIINLVVNARDAMPGGGVISIATEMAIIETVVQRAHEVMPAGKYVLIRVADTGAGIGKEDIGHIFEPFFSTKGVGEGTGLGLSTVYGIIRQSDGFIFVDSAPGEGATFAIYLPAYSAADAIAEAANAPPEIDPDADLTGGGTVLLVEDEDAVRTFGSRALRNKGYRVLEANDGEQALDVINDFGQPIDLIITDVVMPGMDGHTLVRLIQEELPEIKIILMSGYTEDVIPGEIPDDGTIHFLPKPFSLQELAGKVKEVITS